jgi:F-box protein 9
MVWRELCLDAWQDEDTGALAQRLLAYGSWRAMFLERPRLRFDGLYCFKETLLRRGVFEGRGLKDGDPNGGYRPLHEIPVARFLQFERDGRCAILTSTADLTLPPPHPFSLPPTACPTGPPSLPPPPLS